VTSAGLATLLAQGMAWETDADKSGTGWVTWGVCFLLVVIGSGVSVLLRSRRPDPAHSARERLSDADRILQRQATPPSPLSEGIWIGTLEFEPRSPADLLRLVPLGISVNACGEARVVDRAETGEEQSVIAVRWESTARDGDRCSTLTIELKGAGGVSEIRLSLRRESGTWVTLPDAAGPSLRLRPTAGWERQPNAA